MRDIFITVLVIITATLPIPSRAYKIGSTYTFTNIKDRSVITVQKDGRVTAEKVANSTNGLLQQKWKLVKHPTDKDPDVLEFKQEVVPYNELSGFEPRPDTVGIFPRPLKLRERTHGNVKGWNIVIRNRWCLHGIGVGFPLDRDDCEGEPELVPWQLWELTEV